MKKNEILTFSVKISLHIENHYDQIEKRKLDCKLVFESFNTYVEKMKLIVEQEDARAYKPDEEE